MKKGFLIITVLFLSITSCNRTETEQMQGISEEPELMLKSGKIAKTTINYVLHSSMPSAEICGTPKVTTFIAGQNYEAGTVTIANSQEKLYITIQMNEGWQLDCTHLFLGRFAEIPLTNSGNPQVGKFPISDCFKKGVSQLTYELDRHDISQSVTILVHGEVSGVSNETAWAMGKDLEEATRWSWYINFLMDECFVPR